VRQVGHLQELNSWWRGSGREEENYTTQTNEIHNFIN